VQGIRVICTYGDFHVITHWPLDRKRSLSEASTVVEKQTFGAGLTKSIIHNSLNKVNNQADGNS